MIRRILKWTVITVAVLILVAVGTLAVIGVPKPPAITKEGIGRVGWKPVFDNLGSILRTLKSEQLNAWLPDGSGMLASAGHNVLDFRLHTVSEPGGDLTYLPQIPRNAGRIATEPGRPYVVFRWDTDGDESFNLYRWDLGESDPVLLTSGDERASFGAFEPDGDRMAYQSTRRNGTDFDMYVMDPNDPTTDRLVLEREGPWSVADWSPTADELLLVRTLSNTEDQLYRLDLESGVVTAVTDTTADPVNHGSMQYSRDGRALYYSSDRGTEFRHLRRLDLATGEETILTADIPWDVSQVQQSGDGTFLLIGVNENGRTRYYVHDVATDSRSPLAIPLEGIYSAVLHPEEALLRVNHVDALGVERGYVYDMDAQSLTHWVGPEPGEGVVPAVRLVRYPTFDSVATDVRRISAFVYPGAGEGPRPVLVDIHGGPESQATLGTGSTVFQEQGITVIAPNVRGSTGYGKTFTHLDNGYRREDSVRDIGALLDWIAAQPDMDADRVMVMGGSYGGYMVLASLVHFGDRIRCGVDIVGISHFVTFLENTADYRRDLRRPEYGDERDPEMRAFLDSISPLNRVDEIRSRIMIVQGANDPRVPVTESRQFVDRLQENGIPVAYIEAADEGHGFLNPWNTLYQAVAQMEMTVDCLLEE